MSSLLHDEVLEIKRPDIGLEAYIAMSSFRNGMAFGGCRFDMSVSRADVCHLAECMTWKLAPHGLPVGGAKGGVRIDPTSDKAQQVLDAFAKEAAEWLRSKVILGKDLGASNAIMDRIYSMVGVDQLHLVKKTFPHADVPQRIRDLSGYESHMTGRGVAWAARAASQGNLSGKRVLIQGAGAVGLGAAYRFFEMGATVVGMSDRDQAFFFPTGVAPDTLSVACQSGQIEQSKLPSDCLAVKRDELLSGAADILVLAASSNSVSGELAQGVSAPLVVEGANFGLTPQARDVLQKRNVQVVPDILASSASAAMATLQMGSGNSLSAENLWQRVEESIDTVVRRAMDAAASEGTDLRTAYIEGIFPQLIQSIDSL